jgi:two-component system, cell cycle response regulator
MHQAEAVSRFSVFAPLLLVVSLSIASLFALAHYGVTAVDALARATMQERVEVALAVEEQRLADLLVEYAYWDAAYDNLVGSLDPVWADENVGNYLYESVDIETSFVIDGNDNPVVLFVYGEPSPPDMVRDFQSQLAGTIALARAQMASPTPQTQYIVIDGVTHLVALDTFTPEESGQRTPDGSLIGFARRIDDARITRVATLYRLPGLQATLTPDTIPGELKTTIENHQGSPLMVLTWEDQTPAENMRKTLRPYVFVLAGTMSVLIFWVFYIEIRSHRERESMLRAMASIDHLTGIRNRREFFVDAARELAAAKRSGSVISLLLLDIDHFKHINDTLGHVAGDRILGVVGQQLTLKLRDSDISARYGGDEFIAMLPRTDAESTCALADSLRESISTLCNQRIRERLKCTVSIGIAEYQDGESIEHLISRADDALYQAKHGGRDRTVIAGERRGVFPDTTSTTT